MLEIENLETGYGNKQVLFGLSLEVKAGEIVALIGPNGSGKSTVLRTVCGVIPAWKGDIRLDGVSVRDSTPAQNVARGITLAPQGSRVFDGLTVAENLEIGGIQLPRKEMKTRIEEALQMFPILRDHAGRDAGSLSGGEQQVLALARALIPKPRLLMLDEPSLGLSPKLVDKALGRAVEVAQKTGTAVLIVEQKVREVLEISNRVYSIRLGRTAFAGTARELREDQGRLKRLFL